MDHQSVISCHLPPSRGAKASSQSCSMPSKLSKGMMATEWLERLTNFAPGKAENQLNINDQKKREEIWRNMDDFPIPRDCSSDMFEDVCLIPWHARERASRCWSLPTQDSWIEVWIWQTVGKPARMGPRNRSNILKASKSRVFRGLFFWWVKVTSESWITEAQLRAYFSH